MAKVLSAAAGSIFYVAIPIARINSVTASRSSLAPPATLAPHCVCCSAGGAGVAKQSPHAIEIAHRTPERAHRTGVRRKCRDDVAYGASVVGKYTLLAMTLLCRNDIYTEVSL
jgi:hypothetical protein